MADKEVQALQHVNTGVKTVKVRLERVLRRENIESAEEDTPIDSPSYDIELGNESTSWKLRMKKNDGALQMFLVRISSLNGENTKVKWILSIKNPAGKLVMSRELSERKVSEYQRGTGWGTSEFCQVDELKDHYVNNKITVVCDLIFTIKNEQCLTNRADKRFKYDTEESETQFVENMKALYGLNSFSDLVIFCGDQKFLCHKNVLAARSDVFKEMLESEEKKISGELEITETDPDVFKLLVDHVYSGKIPNDIDNVANELYRLAIKYSLQILAKACEISLLDQITDANALETLVIMDQNKFATSAKKDVIKYITINGNEIIDTEEFKTFSKEHPELMIEIFRCLLNQQSKEVLSTMKTEESG